MFKWPAKLDQFKSKLAETNSKSVKFP